MALKDTQTYEDLRKQLKKSSTAYTPNVAPTESDISSQIKMMKRRKAESRTEAEKLTGEWYGDKDKEVNKKKTGLTAFLQTMGMPLSAVAGATEAVLGKGTKKGVLNIPENIKERGTFGDILRSYGMNNVAAMPLGFALDMFADPVSWGTLGVSATIPRVATGGIKGGLEGLKLGAKSAALMKAESAGRVVPGLVKRAFSDNTHKGPVAKFYKELSKHSVEASQEYDRMLGKTLEDRLLKLAERTTIFEKAENKIRSMGDGKGEKALKTFGYFNQRWVNEQKAKQIEKLAKKGASPTSIKKNLDAMDPLYRGLDTKDLPQGKAIADNIIDSADVINNDLGMRAADGAEVALRMRKLGVSELTYRKDIEKEIINIKKILTDKGYDSAVGRMTDIMSGAGEEGFKKKEELVSTFKYFESDLKKYDSQIARAVSTDLGRKMLKNYAIYIGLFKSAKIGGNLLTAGTNAIVGNLAMTSMIGLDVLNTKLFNSMGDAIKIIRGKDMAKIREITSQPDILKTISTYPDLFEGVFGVNPSLLVDGKGYIDKMAKEFMRQGKNMGGIDDVKKAFQDTMGDKIAKSMVKGRQQMTSTVAAFESGAPSTFLSAEVLRGPFGDFRNKIGDLADRGVPAANAFHWLLSKPMEAYNKVDQTYRLGFALHLSKNGVTRKELELLGRRVKIFPKDVKQIPGRNIYKIDFEKAMDLSTEAYMNYLAMPGFVQIMRTLPILGSPFFSFLYGSTALTAKTAVYNPAFFNKVQFLLKEISGRRSPLEKQALEKPYYEWYNQEGMVKLGMLPFCEDNPVYLNTGNMLNYYTMNMFQPTDRNYKTRFGKVVASLIDKVPFFKQPEGQILLDYIVLPNIINEQPQGMFGQPLWRQDAGILEKTGVTARAAAETVMPPLAGIAGLVTPSAMAPYIPNYRWQKLSYAKEGKGSFGVPTKEPPTEKTARIISAMAGLPIYQMKLRYNNKQ